MNENKYKNDESVTDSTECKLKLPNEEPKEAACSITESNLVIESQPSITIPLYRIKVHRLLGFPSGDLEIVYRDDMDKDHKFSLEMENAPYFSLLLSRAIDSAVPRWLESLPVKEKCVGFWRRFVAILLDGIILFFLMISFIIAFLAITSRDPPYDFIGYLSGFVYTIVFWTALGRTPGKMLMGIKIIKVDGTSIGIVRSFLRYIGYIVSLITIFIGYLMIIWASEHRGLHDKIAGTVVVKVR